MDFQLVDAPTFSPTACLLCGTANHLDGMVDTVVFKPIAPLAKARVYLCPDCVASAAGLLGFTQPKEAHRMREELAAQEARIQELEAGLEEAKDTVVVSLKDLKRELRPKAKAS